MSRSPSQIEPTRAFWIASAVVATVFVVGGSLCWRLPQPPPKAAYPANAQIAQARLDQGSVDIVLREEALLRDPTPLFLPTGFSAGAAVSPESVLREPGEKWGGFTARFAFSVDNAQIDMPLPSKPPTGALDALRGERWAMPFLGFGQSDRLKPQLPPRGSYITITSVKDGRQQLAAALEVAPAGNVDWAPIEWLAAVEPSGPAGSPMLLRSSGQETVDRFFLEYLEKTWRLGDRLSRLAPGVYHISLGP